MSLHAGSRAPNSSVIAERLLAHARLCEQVAQQCRHEETARKLRRMASDCADVAAQILPAREARFARRH